MGKWFMKTTLDLPDDLVRRLKFHAIQQNRKLKDTVAFLLEQGMAHAKAATSLPRPAVLRKRRSLSATEVERAIGRGRA
jgi:hypothetical protein